MEYFLCCILIVTNEETGKKIWVHHYICHFIVIVQRKQPLQCLTALQVVLFLTKDQIMSLWSALGCPHRADIIHERDKLRAHLALTSMGYRGHLYLILSPKHRARSNPVQGQQGRVNRNSSMGQAHASENKTVLHHTHSYRPGFPHLLVWCCSDCCSGTGWDVIQFQKQSWGQAGFGGQVKNLHPCLFSPLILSVVEIQTRLVLLITFLPCWFTPQQILLLWKSNMASEQSVQSDWSQLLFPEFKT